MRIREKRDAAAPGRDASAAEPHQRDRAGYPTPRACVADNDLALGRLVEAISRSRYWKESAIFVTEDDAQNGLDHVDGHRTVGLVISPWARRKAPSTARSTRPSTCTARSSRSWAFPRRTSSTSRPNRCFRCSRRNPDFAPYAALPNAIPLDEMNPPLRGRERLRGRSRRSPCAWISPGPDAAPEATAEPRDLAFGEGLQQAVSFV